MRTRFRAIVAPLIALLLLTLLPVATPGRAASTIAQITPTVTVSGRVLLSDNYTPAGNALIWYGPLTAAGSFDYDSRNYVYTLSDGTFSVSLPPDSYGMEILPPNNVASVRALYGYTFNIPAGSTAPVNLGDIALPRADKQISGTVLRSGVGLGSVWVYAYIPAVSRSGRWTLTRSDGSFSLGVEGANWRVYVDNQSGVNWQFVDAPTELNFAADSTPETRTVTFNLPPTVGSIVGRVVLPDGTPFAPVVNGPVGVYVSGENSYFGRYEPLDATGTFTIPVVADTYTLYTSISEATYPTYGVPATVNVTITSGTKSVGNLPLELRNSVLNGLVQDSMGAPVQNSLVQAYYEDGIYRSVSTDNDGRFQLKLAAGTWELAVLPDTSLGFLELDTIQQVTTSADAPTNVSFTLSKAANTLEGSFVEEGKPGSSLLDVRGWAYARDPATDEYVAWDYVTGGTFALNVPAGNLRVGVQLASGSRYSFLAETGVSLTHAINSDNLDAAAHAPFEQTIVVASNTANSPAAYQSVELTLGVNNAVITGKLRDTAGNILIDVPVDVALTPASAGAAWQWADLDERTGTYSIPVRAGTWYLSANVDDEEQPFSVPNGELVAVTVAAGATASSDIVLQRLDGVIEGKVTDNDTPLADQLVWVSNDFFTASVLTEADGAFSIPVPRTNPDRTAASYTLGSDFTCESLTACYIDIEPIIVTPSVLTGTVGDALQQNEFKGLKARKTTGGATLSGRLVNGSGTALIGNTVKAGTNPISGASTVGQDTTKAEGKFSLLLGGSGPFSGKLDVGSGEVSIGSVTARLVAGRLSAEQTIELPTQVIDPFKGLPNGLVAEFDQANGWSATLPDGTRVEIAPNAVPLTNNDGSRVRISVNPTINIFPTSQFAEANWYGYDIELVAVASNRRIAQDLLSPARITLRYDASDYLLRNLNEAHLRPARLVDERWEVAESFIPELLLNRVTLQTKQLGTWALVQERSGCLSCIYIPLVRR